MNYLKTVAFAEIPDGKCVKVNLNGSEILLANVGGAFYALSNKCPHMGGSLSDGTLEDGILTCPRHGAKFDVRTGKSVGNAKLAFVKIKVNDAKSYPVKIEGDDILVCIE